MTNNYYIKALDLPNPTLLRAAAQIQIDFPNDFQENDVNFIEEKLRIGNSSLRTKYWRQIIDASITDELVRGRPLPNHAIGTWGMNPLANAIKKGADLVISVKPEPELAFPKKVDTQHKPATLSAIQLTLLWVVIILFVRAINFLSNS